MAGEAAAVEELPLGADALQHVDPQTAEVTLLTVCTQHAGVRLDVKHRIRRRAPLGGLGGRRGLHDKSGGKLGSDEEEYNRLVFGGEITHGVLVSHPHLSSSGLFLSGQFLLQRKQQEPSRDLIMSVVKQQEMRSDLSPLNRRIM